ncbi:MAG: hypothetical protein PHU71_02720 [Candidatus Gracilibacteria bacterium]|nr:hypothetical protein [Candidatus Gracilibacteria bacterium]
MKKLSILFFLILSLSACDGASLNHEEAATVLRASLSKFLESESYSFELDFSIKQNSSYLEISSSGSSDFSDPANPQTSYESTIKNSAIQSPDGFTIKLNVMQLGEDTYLKITEAPDLNTELLANWQLVPRKKLHDFFAVAQDNEGSTLYRAPFAGELTPEQRVELASYLKEQDLFQITRVYPDTLLNEIPVYQISAELQGTALKEYLLETASLQGKTLSAVEVSKLEQAAQGLYLMLEAYIGREDHRLYKVTGNLKYEDPQQSIESIYKIILNNYGQKLELEVPSDTRPFLETPELDEVEEDLEKLNSKTCQEAMRQAQALSPDSSPEMVAALSQRLREACQ